MECSLSGFKALYFLQLALGMCQFFVCAGELTRLFLVEYSFCWYQGTPSGSGSVHALPLCGPRYLPSFGAGNSIRLC